MELVTNQKELENLVEYSKNEKKRICRLGISGVVHDGHLFILNKIRKECDILIADINEYILWPWRTLLRQTNFPTLDYDFASKVLNESGIVDFLVFNKSTPEYQKESLEFVMKYKDKFYTYCKNLGLTKDLAINCLIFGILSPIDDVTTSYVGPKCITQIKIAEKIFGQENRWSPEFIWDFCRNKDGGTLSRSRGSVVLSHTVSSAVKELKRGVTDLESLNKLMYEYFMEDPHFTIVDLNTVEKVDHITDNCSLIFMDGARSDFVHIKNGELMY
jgi:hypothetical protein